MISRYQKKRILMNSSETALFYELHKQLSKDYYIFPNVRIADVVEVVGEIGFKEKINEILPKHLDFVICDKNFEPKLAIELNGKSHVGARKKIIDEKKKEILGEAGLHLVSIKVGEGFDQVVNQIKTYLQV